MARLNEILGKMVFILAIFFSILVYKKGQIVIDFSRIRLKEKNVKKFRSRGIHCDGKKYL